MGIRGIWLGEQDSKLGSVETYTDARKVRRFVPGPPRRIDGVLVVLPNFGDEKGVADTLKLAGLNVPVLVQAYPDDLDAFNVERRRDAFCGKISVCNNLRQYGYPLHRSPSMHTSHPLSPSFKRISQQFMGVCRVVNGLRSARLGAVGARPNAFNTVRYSEKLLAAQRASPCRRWTCPKSSARNRLKDDDTAVKEQLDEIHELSARPMACPSPALLRMAKFGVVLTRWMTRQRHARHRPAVLELHPEELRRQRLHADEHDERAAHAQRLRGRRHRRCLDVRPAACLRTARRPGGLEQQLRRRPRQVRPFPLRQLGQDPSSRKLEIDDADILATTLGKENTYGAINGRAPAGPMSFARITTDDSTASSGPTVGEGSFTDDPLHTFGSPRRGRGARPAEAAASTSAATVSSTMPL